MDYYWGQFDETIDSVLHELTYYVLCLCLSDLSNKHRDLSSYQYTEDYLEERLLKYPREVVIERLEELHQSLKSVTVKDINNAIPDEQGWEEGEIISMKVNERILLKVRK